jgi:membrane-associated protease RseP (regulator of RpoE activity)
MTILSFLLVIGPLIFIHELGHYFAGRWFGVKADAFSIGFGREIAGWTDKRGTRWKVGWLPLGGYVKFKGDMNPASQPSKEWLAMPPEERSQTFQAKPVWQRGPGDQLPVRDPRLHRDLRLDRRSNDSGAGHRGRDRRCGRSCRVPSG